MTTEEGSSPRPGAPLPRLPDSGHTLTPEGSTGRPGAVSDDKMACACNPKLGKVCALCYGKLPVRDQDEVRKAADLYSRLKGRRRKDRRPSVVRKRIERLKMQRGED